VKATVSELLATILIERRFRGPPRSGNGGYVCGRLAEFIAGDSRVRLLRPPPLDRDLVIVADQEGLSLLDGEQPIARAWPQALQLELPPGPSLEEARHRSHRYRGFEAHAFSSCFVCGPDRAPGDGLRIFPGANEDGVVASPWRPDAWLADDQGFVQRRYVWAALDCPSGWAYLDPGGRVAVLGELAVHIEQTVPAEEEAVVIGWPIDDEGRKHHCGSALFTGDGRPLAWAVATWFDIDPESLTP
jgi:hypothetical protein